MVDKDPKISITFQPEGKRIKVPKNSTILNAALLAGIDLISICNGKGTCGKCKVIIHEQSCLNKISEKEQELLTPNDRENNVRLACFSKVEDNLIVRIPEYSRTGKQRLQVEGIETPIANNPSIKKYYLEIEEPTLEDPRSDIDRVISLLQSKYNLVGLSVNFNILRNFAEKIREFEWKITVVLSNNEIISIESEDTTMEIYGYAVDIGTTKLAGYLLDLNTGKVIAVDSLMNPQIPFGEDVISRLNFPDQYKLQKVVLEGINQILDSLKEKSGIKAENIYEMTAVGNTVMHHIFLGINPLFLGRSPYPPVIRNILCLNANQLGININSNGKIIILPVIAGFVGADTIGVILSSEMHKRDEICLAIDIGTNTEVVLGNKDKLIAASCASGPAFEGAHIKFGMRASSGSIEKIKIEPHSFEVLYETIDNAPPIGICGSGMIDLVAEMLRVGIIDVGGIIKKDLNNPQIRKNENSSMEYVVVPATNTANNKDITFSQQDINQIILAKAAIHTGIKLLLKNYPLSMESIREVFIAGAFGSHINKESARVIGLFPEIDLDKITVIGNAAGTGSRMALVSNATKEISEEISKKVQYLEIGNDKDFQSIFLNSHIIPYADLSEFPEVSNLLKKFHNYPTTQPPKF